MKWFIASDIHGSAFFCRKMIDAYSTEKADRMLLLGDLLYHGPRNNLPDEYDPKQVISLLNGIKNDIFCVRGNCDSEVDQMVLDFPIMAEYALLTFNEKLVFATHGHKYNLQNLPSLHKGDILLNGHTHISGMTENNGIICCNPGSVSIPKEKTENGYMLLDDCSFIWKNFDGRVIKQYSIE